MTFPGFPRLFLLLLLAVLLGACAAAPAPQPKPKLIVFLAIDGLPQRQVLAYRDQLAPDGLARFLDRGAWFSQAHHAHGHTVTAAGHASMLTGAYPQHSGIIGNEWRDPETGAVTYCTADQGAAYIGHKTDALDGTSPRNLKAETLGDVLRRADPRSKVIAVSGKDRGAILMAGKAGTAYMYMDDTGLFASSTFYMQRHPGWVEQFNAGRPADRYFQSEWKPLLPEGAYARSLAGNQPWSGPGPSDLPMRMGAPSQRAPGPAFYAALWASPFVDALTLSFARAAVAGEGLGRDEAPDILAVSLSGHDYVNHLWSAESRISHDHVLQLDRMLQSFFHELDSTVGRDSYVAVLTSDHGFMPNPEYSRSRGLDAGRIRFSQVLARLNAGLAGRFGAGKWVIGHSAGSLLLDKQLIAQHKLSVDAVAGETRKLLLAEPGFAAAFTRSELLSGSAAGKPYFQALRRSWHPEVSGEVQYAVKPNWMFGSSVATHGGPGADDTHVPVMLFGPRWVKPGRADGPVEVVDIAPTLARLLAVPQPASSQGRPLPLDAP
jgi:predicted AlkP superfamily pyrophosphatase or phosphodiesterase